MATKLRLSPWEQDSSASRPAAPAADEGANLRAMAAQFGINVDQGRPRVVMTFPTNPNDMLLSGTLQNGQLLSGRAQVVDATVGDGHVVMFAIRPFWRWQTQGTYFLGFNAILNWNDLHAKAAPPARPASAGHHQIGRREDGKTGRRDGTRSSSRLPYPHQGLHVGA
jgi:hypothetical protein